MRSQSQCIASADISASTFDKIRTIPALFRGGSHERNNAPVWLPRWKWGRGSLYLR